MTFDDGRRIVVTGLGAYAGGVIGSRALRDLAVAGRSPADWVTLPQIDQPFAAVRVPDPALTGAAARHARRLDRSAKLALAAASQAIEQAGLDDAIDPTSVGVMVGTSRASLGRTLETAAQLAQGGVGPTAASDSTPASVAGVIGQVFGFGGATAAIVATCASGATAIGLGATLLRAGEAEIMVVGGTEAPIIPLLVAQLRAAGVTGWHEDPQLTCRPFDARRNGLVVGEGAAFMVLETAERAERRGARPLAALSGWASGVDGGGRTGATADGDGLVRVVERALAAARLAPTEVGYVNAHGTGTRLNDVVESRALNRVFGAGSVPPVSSTKPITGHCLGATPAIEAVIAIEALRAGCMPPTANHEQLDSECELDVVHNGARPSGTSAVLSTSLGFWGAQAALVFEAI